MCKEILQASKANIKQPDKNLSKGYEQSIHKKNKYK